MKENAINNALNMLFSQNNAHCAQGRKALSAMPLNRCLNAYITAFDHPQLEIRQWAYMRILEEGRPHLERLMEKVQSGSESRAYYCCRIIAHFSGDKAQDFFMGITGGEKPPYLRKMALEGLKFTGFQRQDLKALIRLFADETWEIRRLSAQVVASFGAFGLDEIIPFLQDKSPDIRYWTAKVLQEIMGQESLKFIRSLGQDESWFVRAQLAFSLGELGGLEDLEMLEKMVNDENEFTSSHAKEAIINIKQRHLEKPCEELI